MAQSKEQQGEQVGTKQQQVEVAIQEEPLGKEAPVDRPLEHELSAKIKCPAQVTDGILQEERKAQQELQRKDGFFRGIFQRGCVTNHEPHFGALRTFYLYASTQR